MPTRYCACSALFGGLMFALSIALLALATLAYQAEAATFIWTTCAFASIVAMTMHRRNRDRGGTI
jgi:hypothetical protein